jgi:hypothetical protein
MRLVPNWRDSWRWISVHVLALSIALQGALLAMPYDIRAYLPEWLTHYVAIILLLVGIAGRLVDQRPKGDCDARPEQHP